MVSLVDRQNGDDVEGALLIGVRAVLLREGGFNELSELSAATAGDMSADPLRDGHRVEPAGLGVGALVAVLAERGVLRLQDGVERLPIARRVGEIVGLAVEDVERTRIRGRRLQHVIEGQAEVLGEIAYLLVIAIDELTTMFRDLAVTENAACRVAAAADPGTAFVDIGVQSRLAQFARGCQTSQPRTDNGDPRGCRQAGERQRRGKGDACRTAQDGATADRGGSWLVSGPLRSFGCGPLPRQVQEHVQQRGAGHGDVSAKYEFALDPRRVACGQAKNPAAVGNSRTVQAGGGTATSTEYCRFSARAQCAQRPERTRGGRHEQYGQPLNYRQSSRAAHHDGTGRQTSVTARRRGALYTLVLDW